MAFVRRAANNFLTWKGMSDRGKVVLVCGSIFGLTAYQVLSSTRVGGNAALSNEKPESLRGETKRSLAEEKAKAAAAAGGAGDAGGASGAAGSPPLR